MGLSYLKDRRRERIILAVVGLLGWAQALSGFSSTPLAIFLVAIGFILLIIAILPRAHFEKLFRWWPKKYIAPPTNGYCEVHSALLWIINFSAWIRWQEAQHLANNGKPLGEWIKMSLAASILRTKIEDGQLVVRARQRDRLEYEEISPDVWQSTYLDFKGDTNTIWRATMKAKDGLDWEAKGKIPDYVSFQVSEERVEELWPKKKRSLDALTRKLLKQAKKRRTG